MKTLLVTLNSKFTHTSLALRCLRSVLPEGEAEILECTVNQPKDEILRQICARPADVYAFSVYIFNRTLTCAILSDLRKIRTLPWTEFFGEKEKRLLPIFTVFFRRRRIRGTLCSIWIVPPFR